MTWILAIGLALAALAFASLVLRAPQGGWLAIGAALAAGLAGYAFQGNPGLAGAPKAPAIRDAENGAALIEARKRFFPGGQQGRNYMIIADAFTRQGQFGNAVGVLRAAVSEDPDDAEAWLAMANALVAHAQGTLPPAAGLAYRRAQAAAPENAGPAFFLGAVLLGEGRLEETRELWSAALAGSPPDAPWREDLSLRVKGLEELIRLIEER